MEKQIRLSHAVDWRKYRSGIALAVVMLAMAAMTEGAFFSARNISNLARQVSLNGILSIGMTYVILLGGIDLSVGSIVALTGVICGLLQVNQGLALWDGYGGVLVTLAAAIGVGLACGLFNAWWITRYRIAPFIITLGMMVIARGVSLILSNGASIAPLGERFNEIGQGYLSPTLSVIAVLLFGAIFVFGKFHGRSGRGAAFWGSVGLGLGVTAVGAWSVLEYRGLPIPVLMLMVLAALGIFILEKTRLGRFVMAVGGNAEAAWLAGVPIRAVSFWIYVVMGGLAGLAGAVLSARLNGAQPTAGELFELDAIAAVVLGGTSLTGGVGTVQGSLIGALFLGVLNNGMSLLQISEFYQKVIKGVIIILAVWFDMRGKKTD